MNAKANDVNRRGLLKRTAWIGMTAVSVFAMASTASAATYYVSPTGDDDNVGSQAAPFKTIQKALDSANAWGGSIIIQSGTDTISSQLKTADNQNGITIRSATGDPADVTIDAQGLCRCLDCTGTGQYNFYFRGITFANGAASGNGGGVLASNNCKFDDCIVTNCNATGNGGGIYAVGPITHVCNVTVYGCSATSATSNGGGIYLGETPLRSISNVCIKACTSGQYGGGLYLKGSSTGTIVDCDILGNSCGTLGGGGIYAKNVIVRDCTIASNVCNHAVESTEKIGGSGIRLDTSGSIDGCLIEGNSYQNDSSSYSGGGSAVWLVDGASLVNSAIVGNTGPRSVGMQWSSTGGILVSNCLFKSNVARRADAKGRGGILSLWGLKADSLITDCRFIDNQAAAIGGFVEMDLNSGSKDSTLRIRNCLISGNSQSAGNGLVWANSGTSATANRLVLENCTIVSNTVAQAPVIRPYTESSSYTSGNFVNVRGCAILFNGGKAAFNNSYEASANVTYNCTEMSGMSAGNITYDSTKPLFEDIANGNYRPAAGSQLCDIVPAAAWMGDWRKKSPSRDLGTGYGLLPAETYGVNVVWTDTLPRLSGSAADIGAFERWIQPGLNIIIR